MSFLFDIPEEKINPKEDGITHINIYSKGNTPLGVFLSNFTYYPIKFSGKDFSSVEALWYWLGVEKYLTDEEDSALRNSYGYSAKRIGRELKAKYGEYKVEGFEDIIKRAIKHKILTSEFYEDFISSTLPFKHYYVVYGNVKDVGPDYPWLLEHIEDLRKTPV